MHLMSLSNSMNRLVLMLVVVDGYSDMIMCMVICLVTQTPFISLFSFECALKNENAVSAQKQNMMMLELYNSMIP